MRPPYPVTGVPTDPETIRYTARATRYDDNVTGLDRGPSGVYVTLPTTLEEEVQAKGWLPGAMPTGDPPRELFTTSMRGEPGLDDDPNPTTGNSYKHGSESIDVGDDSSWD
jgi:hypothetical protein